MSGKMCPTRRSGHYRQRLGIAAGREFIAVSAPQPLMNKDIKVKVKKQKPKGASPARTEADSKPQPKITTSRPACSNTFVSGRLLDF